MAAHGYTSRDAAAPVAALGAQTPRIGKIKGHMLKHAEPLAILVRHGRQVPMPMNQSDTYVMRRWIPGYGGGSGGETAFKSWNKFFQDSSNADPASVMKASHALTEGHTPQTPESLTAVDVSVTIDQYGCLYGFTDKVAMFYEDNVPQEMVRQAGERMSLVNEMIVWAALKSNTNKFYGGTADATADVNGTITLNMIRKVTAQMKALHGKPTTSVLSSSEKFGTDAVEAGYFCFVHTDMEPVIRDLAGFTPAAEYGSGKALPYELGKVETFRFICSPELAPRQNGGATASGTGLQSTGTGTPTKVDVYSCVVLAQDHFCQLAVRGKQSMSPIFIPHDMISKDDPLGQRGYVGLNWWKSAKIENQGWGAILEVGIPSL